MRKIKEVLRQDQIARSCSIGQATVHRYLEKAAAAGLSWPLAEEWDDRRLDDLLFPAQPGHLDSQPRPSFGDFCRDIKRGRCARFERARSDAFAKSNSTRLESDTYRVPALGASTRNACGNLRTDPAQSDKSRVLGRF